MIVSGRYKLVLTQHYDLARYLSVQASSALAKFQGFGFTFGFVRSSFQLWLLRFFALRTAAQFPYIW